LAAAAAVVVLAVFKRAAPEVRAVEAQVTVVEAVQEHRDKVIAEVVETRHIHQVQVVVVQAQAEVIQEQVKHHQVVVAVEHHLQLQAHL
jgi:hypothetical protein